MNTLDLKSREIEAYNFGWYYGETCKILEHEVDETKGEQECKDLVRNLNAQQREAILALFWQGFAEAEI